MFLSRYIDRLAIALSTICIVHCLAMPLLLALVPMAAIFADGDGHFHQLLLWLVVPTSALGFGFGYRLHRNAGIVGVGVVAVAILGVVAFYGHYAWGTVIEVAVSVVGSVMLAGAHWRNFREVRRLHRHV